MPMWIMASERFPAAFMVADQTAPSCHAAEHSFDDPATWQDLAALLVRELAHGFDDEAMIGSGAHQIAAVIGAFGEQVLQSGPALADGPDDLLCPGHVLHAGCRQVDQ
jgi:hypothetical protein